MAILLVFLITALLVKVRLDALPFFVITMIKIMLINCKQGWEGPWGTDLPTCPHPAFRPQAAGEESIPTPRGNGCHGQSGWRGQSGAGDKAH